MSNAHFICMILFLKLFIGTKTDNENDTCCVASLVIIIVTENFKSV